MHELPPGEPRRRRPSPAGLLRDASDRARRAGAVLRARGTDSLDRALDRVFAEPFDVPDRATAVRLLSGAEPAPMGVLGRYLEGQALVRIAAQVTKLAGRSRTARAATRVAAVPAAMAATGSAGATGAAATTGATVGATVGATAMSTATSMGAAALAAAAVAAATRATRSVRRGLHDLRVLSSYLSSRARAERIPVEPGLLRALTLAVYTDPRRHADVRLAGSRGAAAVLGRWSRDATLAPSDLRRREDAEAWVAAIDRLDLQALSAQWASRA